MTMRTIAIVAHCYAEQIPDYAAMFTAQLSSIALWPPKTCVLAITCWTAETDSLTHRVVAAFQQHFRRRMTPASIIARNLPKRELFRRAIGRNISCKEATADVLWMADVDYVCGDGFFDALAAVDFEAIKPHEMVFPRKYHMMLSHEIGDKEIACISPGSLHEPNVNEADYFKKRLKLGIGGLQFIPRDVAIRGYCDGTNWIRPLETEMPFPDTNCDRIFRGTIRSSIPADLPNLFRYRHSRTSYEPVEKRKLRMGKK